VFGARFERDAGGVADGGKFGGVAEVLGIGHFL
jgi:hypothetical protein